MKNSFADFIIKMRLPVIIAFLVLTVVFFIAAWSGLSFKSLDSGLRPEGYPNIKLNDEFRKKFGGTNLLYFVLQVTDKEDGGEYDDIFNFETLNILKSIDTDLQDPKQFPAMDRNKMFSLASSKMKDFQVTSKGMVMPPIMYPKVPTTQEGLDKLRMNVYQGFAYPVLVSFDSKTTILMADFFEKKADWDDIAKRLIALQKKYETKNVKISLNCLPVEKEYIRTMIPNVVRVLALSVLLIAVILFLSMRSVSGVIIALLAGIVSGIWGLGLLGFMKFNLDPALFGIPLFISLIAVVNAAFFIKRFAVERAGGADPAAAAKATIAELKGPCATAMLIAGICLALVALAPLPALRPLFLSGIFWAFASFIINVALVPSLLTYLPVTMKKGREKKLMHRSARFVCGWGKYVVIVVCLLGTIMGLASMGKMYYGNATPGSTTLLPWHQYNMDAFRMSFSMPLLTPLLIVAEGEVESAIGDNPALIRDTMEFCRYMGRTPMDPKMGPVVVAPVSMLTSMPGRSRATHENDPNWTLVPKLDGQLKMFYATIVNMAAPGSMDKFIVHDHKAMCFYIYCRDKTESVITPVKQRIREYITEKSPFGIRHADVKYPDTLMRSLDSLVTEPEPLLPEKPQVDKLPHITYRIGGGPIAIQADVNSCVRLYFFWTFIFATLAVLAIVALRYGSLVVGIISLLPLLFAAGITFIYASKPNTAPLTAETLPYLMMGYSLFAGGVLYMLNRIAVCYAASKSWEQAIADAMFMSGKVSVAIAMSLLVGFIYVLAPFTLPHFMPVSVLSNMFVFMGLCSMLATLYVVPACIALFKPAGLVRSADRG